MAEYKEYKWKSDDGLELFGCSWLPEVPPVGVINLVHGLGEHSGRYRNWAEKFVNEGYAFVSFDYRGHGKSQGRKGHTAKFGDILSDIDVLLGFSRNLFPGVMQILYGHSLGGTLVINYVQNRKLSPAAIVVTSPFLRHAKEPPRLTLLMGRLVRYIWPSLLMGNGLHSSDLSHNSKVASLYKEDPLVHDRISPALYFGMREGGERALQNRNRLNMPVLLMHGTADRITSCEASQEFAQYHQEDVTLRLWNDLFHELHNEPAAEEIFQYILNWLKGIEKNKSTGHGYF